MLKAESSDLNEVIVIEKTAEVSGGEQDLKISYSSQQQTTNYIQNLKDKVLEEIMERIEKKMDINAAEILDAARVRLRNLSANSKLIMIAMKPVFLLFVIEVYLEVQVNI